MTRAPRAGQTKTRLQPLLGATGCARLQRVLIIHTVAVVAAGPPSLHVAVDPSDALAEVADIAGPGNEVFAQEGDPLGALRGLNTPEDAHALSIDGTVAAAIRSILSRQVARALPRPAFREPQPGPA